MDGGAHVSESREPFARVEAVPLTAVPERFRRGEIQLMLRPRADGLPAAHYLAIPEGTPGGRDVVAVVALGIVDSPDEVRVEEVRLDGHRLFLHVHIREFEGRLAANVQRLALVMIDIGDLQPGRYHVEVQVDRYQFTDYERPETATFDRSWSYDLQVEVVDG